MKSIRKRRLSILLACLMLLSLQPAAVLADEPVDGSGSAVTLDIADGSITITETGYKQGDATEETAYTGTYILTGTYSDSFTAATTAATNQVKISAGSENTVQVTLKDLTIKHHSGNNSNKYAGSIYSPIQVLSGTVELSLEGSSTLIGDGNNSGLFIAQDATTVIKGDGSLTCYGGNQAPGIGACKNTDGAAGSLIVESGNLLAKAGNDAAGIGAANNFGMQSVTINGGYVDTYGGTSSYSIGRGCGAKLNNLTITGGTILCSGGAYKQVTGNTVSITGGNVGDFYAGTVEGRKKTTLYFMNEDNTPVTNTEVTVTEDEHTWTAKTDANGKVITYLLNDTTSISAAVGDNTAASYAVTDAGVLIGGNCSPSAHTGELTISGLPDDSVTIDSGATKRIPFTVSYTGSDCTAPIHPAYGNVTYTIESVTQNGAAVSDPGSYASLSKTDEGAALFLNYKENETYIVTVKAVAGPEGAQISKTAAVTASCGEWIGMMLDITDGSITITETGYKQGDATEETAYTGAYILSGTYELYGTVDADTNQVKISAGSESTVQVTLKDLTIKHHNGNNSTQYADSIYSPIQVLSGTVELSLEGSSTLIGDGKNSGIYIAQDATAVINGSGSLTCYGGNNASGIGACNYTNGAAGSLIINSGNFTIKSGNNAAGIGAAYSYGMQNVTINGGYVDAIGGSSSYSIGHGRNGATLENLTITGGTILCSGGTYKQAIGKTVSITGGNIGDFYAGTVDGRKKTTLYFMNDDNTLVINSEVTVTEGDHTWTAKTDANGKVITYLLNDTTSISAAVGDNTAASYAVTNVGVLIGGNCACDGDGSLTISGLPADSVTVDSGAAGKVISYTATYTPDSDCTAPIHPAYGNVTYTIESITQNGADISNPSSYASISKTEGGAILFLNYKENENYTVTVKAATGPEDAQVSKTATVEVTCVEASGSGLDIGDGSITVEAGPNDTSIYRQGDNGVYTRATERMIITGTSDTNTLTVNSGNPTIVLRDVNLTSSTTCPVELLSGSTTLWLEGDNTITSGSTNNEKAFAIRVGPGAKLTIDSEVDELNGTALNVFKWFSFVQKLQIATVKDPVPVKYKGSLTVSGRGGIGTWTVNQKGTEINIKGGNIDASKQDTTGGSYQAVIGGTVIGEGSTQQEEYRINITGGNVRAVVNGIVGTAIGGKNAVVTITGGCISAEHTQGSTSPFRGMGIGGVDSSVIIGTQDSTESEPYVRAVGKVCYAGIGGLRSNVTIHSGTVYAEAAGNAAAIGGNFSGSSGPITITGGTVGASNQDIMLGASIGTRASTGQLNNLTPLPVVIHITGGTVITRGVLGGGPDLGDSEDTSSVTIAGADTSVKVLSCDVFSNVKVEKGANFTTSVGRIRGSLAVSDKDTNVLINGSVDHNVTGTSGSYTRVTGRAGGNVLCLGGGTVVIIGNSQTAAKLDTPVVTIVNDKTATWNAVENASKYNVVLKKNGTEFYNGELSETEFDFSSYVTETGEYSVVVKANNEDDLLYKVSDPSDEVTRSYVVNSTVTPTSKRYITGSDGFEVTMSLNGNTFDSITGLTKDVDYSVNGNVVKIFDSVLDTSKTLTFCFSAGEDATVEITVQEAAEAANLVLAEREADSYAVDDTVANDGTSDGLIVVAGTDGKPVANFISADFTISNTENIGYDKIEYELAPADGFALSYDEDKGVYHIHVKSDNGESPEITENAAGEGIVIGKLVRKGTGYGKGVIRADNIVITVGKTDTENTTLETNSFQFIYNVPEPTEKLTVIVDFAKLPTKTDNAADYQNMKVTLYSTRLGNIELALGNDNTGYESTGGKIKAAITADENNYTIVVEGLPAFEAYTVSISGDGYRDAKAQFVLNEETTVSFWNNVNESDRVYIAKADGEQKLVRKNFLAGDIIMNNVIDIYDLSAVSSCFGKKDLTGNDAQDIQYDLNRDGKVDIIDITMILSGWAE